MNRPQSFKMFLPVAIADILNGNMGASAFFKKSKYRNFLSY